MLVKLIQYAIDIRLSNIERHMEAGLTVSCVFG